MKKIITSLICLSILLSNGIVAFAEETKNMTLSYSNEASYEILIPSALDIDKQTKKASTLIELTDVSLEIGTAVFVTMESENYDDGWYLVDSRNPSEKIEYKVGTTYDGNDISNSDKIILSDEAISKNLYFSLIGEDKVGYFSDILTFTIGIEEYKPYTIDTNKIGESTIEINSKGVVTVTLGEGEELEQYSDIIVMIEGGHEALELTYISPNSFTFNCIEENVYVFRYFTTNEIGQTRVEEYYVTIEKTI